MLNFVIAGVARSGTSHLCRLLDKQSSIYIAKPFSPEPKFFSRDINYNMNIQWYLNKYFSCSDKYQLKGEKSTEYIEAKLFPERAKKCFPDLKIIIILRNPIERLISNYEWSTINGVEKRTLQESIEDELSNGVEKNGTVVNIIETRPNVYLGRSFYFDALTNIFNYFSKKNVLLIDFYQYSTDINSVINQLERFLEIKFDIKETDDIDKNSISKKTDISRHTVLKLQDLFYYDIESVNKHFNLNLSTEYNM